MVCNRGKYKDLSVRFLIKLDDYTMAQYEELCDQAIDGTCGALAWQPFGEKEEKKPESHLAKFRREVVQDFGLEAYAAVKKRLGCEHLKDIPGTEAEVSGILEEELFNLRKQAGFYDQLQ